MYKKQNKYILVIMFFVGILFIAGFVKTFFSYNDKFIDTTNMSIYRIDNSISKNITSRQILRKDNVVFVGNSKKEIENGYYDLKIMLEDRNVKLYINKLWKVFNQSLYEKDYVREVINSVFDIFEINQKKQKECLIQYITNGYLVSKGVNKENSSNEQIYIDKIRIKSEIVDSELILNICKEVKCES